MTEHTSGPWKLIWHGNETYPFPLSVHTEDDKYWVARDGTVSNEANARLIAAAPDLLAALEGLVEQSLDVRGAWDQDDAHLDFDSAVEKASAVIAKTRNLENET